MFVVPTFLDATRVVYSFYHTDSCYCTVVVMQEGDEWRCEKCQKAHKDFKYRIMLSLSALDPTAQLWVTCFSETAEVILGQTAKKMGELQDAGDEATIDKIHRDAYFKQYMFKCRAKSDTYQGETRVKCSVVGVTPVDYVSESKYLVRVLTHTLPYMSHCWFLSLSLTLSLSGSLVGF